ncbi:MAG: glycosyltransferase, partial [Nitrososphaerota archaeon]
MNKLKNFLLSIVVTSYTTERIKDIFDLFESIRSQTILTQSTHGNQIELIFIAEGSRELYKKVKEYGEKIGFFNFKALFSEEKLGLGGARNIGSEEASGEIIAFVDDDVILSPEWAQEMLRSYEDEEVIGVTGSVLPLWKDKRLDWLPKNCYWLISCTDWTDWENITEARSLWGGNMSLRKEAFEKSGSFLQTLGYHAPMAEDLELSLRVRMKTGKKLLFNPRAKAWHKVYGYRVNLKYVALRAHHIGVSRRLLRITSLGEHAPFYLEKRVLKGLAKIFLSFPCDFFKNPYIAWRKFIIVLAIVFFAGWGFLFP